MKINHHDEKIIEHLQKMPEIKDHRSKDELFQRISSQVNQKGSRGNNIRILMPFLGGILAIAIIFIIVRPLIGQNGVLLDEASHHEEKAVMESSANDNDKVEKINDRLVSPSYVVQGINEDSIIVYGAVSDDQLQTVIPISIIFPQTNNVNESYNQIATFLNESEWGVNDYLFADVSFDINVDDKQVIMELPESFSIGEGSANSHIFGQVLATMFEPLGIEEIVFNHEVDLGPIGEVTEFSLQEKSVVNYKSFQAAEHQRRFLVPTILEEGVTIESAVEDLKNSQSEFNIESTVPAELELSFSSEDNELFVTFDHHYEFASEEDIILMVESILMTAKSFNYDTVTFVNTPDDTVGPYNFSSAIPVPKAVNPVYIND